MIPIQLQQEVTSLNEAGYLIELHEVGTRIYLVFKEYQLPNGNFNCSETDLLIWTSTNYPYSGFDMFWVNEELRLFNNGIPKAANSIENHIGKRWRRFSIHPYQHTPWNPALDNVNSFLAYIKQRLNFRG